jgi:hypothetical protein
VVGARLDVDPPDRGDHRRAEEVTIIIVTHNLQQALFFLAEQGTPGVIVEHGSTSAISRRRAIRVRWATCTAASADDCVGWRRPLYVHTLPALTGSGETAAANAAIAGRLSRGCRVMRHLMEPIASSARVKTRSGDPLGRSYRPGSVA